MTRSQQLLVKQVFSARFAQLQRDRDEELRVNRVHKRGIMACYQARVADLDLAYSQDFYSEYPLCLNPKLNLRPEIIETKWGVLFA